MRRLVALCLIFAPCFCRAQGMSEARPEPAAPAASATIRMPLQRGPAFAYAATALAVADFRGDGGLAAAVSDGRKVYLYPYPPLDARPLAEYAYPGGAARLLSLEGADLAGDGRAAVFVSLYNDAFSRFETVVLTLDAKGVLRRAADIPYLVRGYQDPEGRPRLAAQQVADDAAFPFGAIHPLVFKDGRYGPGKPALSFPGGRVDWLYDFTFLSSDGKAATVDVTAADRLRVRFPGGTAWKSALACCEAPHRVRWAGDRWLPFRPALAVRDDARRRPGLYAVHNIAALDGLAAPLGLYSSAELRRFDFDGLGLDPSWTAELGGYGAGLALVRLPGGKEELAALVVGAAGKSAIWTFAP